MICCFSKRRLSSSRFASLRVHSFSNSARIQQANVYFERRDFPIVDYYDCGQKPTAKEATAISDKLLARYLSGDTDSIELLYTRFVSLIASTPSARTLLPLTATGIESEGDEIFQLTTNAGDFSVEKTKVRMRTRDRIGVSSGDLMNK